MSVNDIVSFKFSHTPVITLITINTMPALTVAEEDFTSIPVLDFSQAQSPEKNPDFLSELRNALVRVGFFYVKNHSIPAKVQEDAMDRSFKFFDLPLDTKLEIENTHSKHFLGYSSMKGESTASRADNNESIQVSAEPSLITALKPENDPF